SRAVGHNRVAHSYRLTALLPYCPTALLPSLTALLPQVFGTLLPPERVTGREPGPAPLAPLLPNASPVISARPASEPIRLEASSGSISTFWFGALASASSAFT